MAGAAFNVYRPSAFLRLQIRLEDYDSTDDPTVESEGKPYRDKVAVLDADINGLEANIAEVKGSGDSGQQEVLVGLDAAIRKKRQARKRLLSAPAPARAQQGAKGDAYSVDIYTIPLDLSVEMNSFRIADTMHATIPFSDAPLISDIIRSCLVEVWLGTIPPDDFATDDHWRLRRDRAVIVFRGYADTWDTDHGDSDSTVQISARSLEAILIDAKINPLAPVYRIEKGKSGELISAYINRILGQLPATAGTKQGTSQLKAVWYGSPDEAEPPLDRKSLLRSLQSAKSRVAQNGGQNVVQAKPEGGTDPGQTEGAAPGAPGMPPAAPGQTGQDMSVWDLITQACELAGCLPLYDPSLPGRNGIENTGDYLLLRPPQTIFEDVDGGYKIPGGPIDGFERVLRIPQGEGQNDRTVQITSQIRFLVWGHNIKSFKTSRKLGRVKVQGVEIRSYNPDGKKGQTTMVARFPKAPHHATRIGAKGEGKTQELMVKVVRGIRDQAKLEQIAVSLYHAVSRQELSVSIETADMASYIDPTSGLVHNDHADMLKLRPGTPCKVAVARQVKTLEGLPTISPLSEVFEKRGEVITQLLTAQRNRAAPDTAGFQISGSPEEMAKRISKALAAAKITDVFYCRTITHKFTADEGWSAVIELVNYLPARGDPKNMPKEDQKTNDAKKLHPRVTSAAAKNQAKIASATDRAIAATQGKL